MSQARREGYFSNNKKYNKRRESWGGGGGGAGPIYKDMRPSNLSLNHFLNN